MRHKRQLHRSCSGRLNIAQALFYLRQVAVPRHSVSLKAIGQFGQQVVYLRLSARPTGAAGRSEEHTSELQSRPHLVCRLLLEKKNALAPQPFTATSI